MLCAIFDRVVETIFNLEFLFIIFVHCLHLEYPSYDESYESNEEEYDKLGSESGTGGTFGIVFGGLLRGVVLP